MPPPTCCNPLNKARHKSVYKNVKFVSEKWKSEVFKPFIGNFMCSFCERDLRRQKINVKEVVKNWQKPAKKVDLDLQTEDKSSSDSDESVNI